MSHVSDGDKVICPKCKRPKATPRDVIRWLSRAIHYEKVCFDEVDYSRLLPDEEAEPGADLLKKRLAKARKQRDMFVCEAIAAVTK